MKSAPAASAIDALCMTVSCGEVGVREHDLVDVLAQDQVGELVLGDDRNAPADTSGPASDGG